MKNIAEERPWDELHGRSWWIINNIDEDDFTNKIVLNIGVGFGWFEYHMASKTNTLYGIEPTENALTTARKYLKGDNLELLVGDAINIPFEDGYFDTVVSWDVIEHIPKHCEKKMFREIDRVLKNGGRLYLTTPYRSFRSCVLDPAWWFIGHRHYSKNAIKDYLRETRFEDEIILTKGRIWTILYILDLYIAKWMFRRKPFFSDFFNKKDNEEWEKNGGYHTLFLKVKKPDK